MCLAVPGKIESITGDDTLVRTGIVRFGGVTKEVNLACVPDARVGDYVIVHVGLAISRLDEASARSIFAYLEEIGDLETMEDE